MAKQRLADVHCTPMRFAAGDRILVTTRVPVDPNQKKQIQKTVERWAGNHVEVLVVDGTKMALTIQKPVIIGVGVDG